MKPVQKTGRPDPVRLGLRAEGRGYVWSVKPNVELRGLDGKSGFMGTHSIPPESRAGIDMRIESAPTDALHDHTQSNMVKNEKNEVVFRAGK